MQLCWRLASLLLVLLLHQAALRAQPAAAAEPVPAGTGVEQGAGMEPPPPSPPAAAAPSPPSTPAPALPASPAPPAPPAPASPAPPPPSSPPSPRAFQELYEHPDRGREAFVLRGRRQSLSFNLLTQVQPAFWVQEDALVDNDDPATTAGFRLRRARLGLYGTLQDELGLNLVIDLRDEQAGGNTVYAANVLYRPHPLLNLALGTAPLPFSRAATTSATWTMPATSGCSPAEPTSSCWTVG